MGGIFILILYIILGVIIGAWLFEDCRPLKRIWLGGVIGMMLMMWSHVPFSFFMGFTVWSHMLGLVFSAAICTVIVFLKSGGKTHSIDGRGIAGRWLVPLNKNEVIMAVSVTTLMLVSVVLLFNHILVEIDGAYYTGQCTYGDMNMHLGFISSIARQGMFPPTYSIMAGEPLNYPFLCDSISSSMMLFGASLRCAYIAPMIFAFMWVYTGCWYIAEAILERVGRVWLAFTLFFLDGGFGIIYFLDNLKGEDKSNFTRIFTAFYETPTNYVNSDRYVLAANGSDFVAVKGYSNIRWTNIIADMLLPQRATLFGWMCLFAVLYLLYMAVFKDKKQYFIIAGIMGGLLPMIHTHSYFALGLIAICWIIYSCVKKRFNKEIIMSWLSFGAPALALSVPQLLKWDV